MNEDALGSYAGSINMNARKASIPNPPLANPA